MAYEVDFLPVGEGEKSGDAIAMRFGDLSRPDGQTVIVIDSGFGAKTGQQLAALIRNCYHASWVDLVVSTHPDLDHIGGLETILDEFEGNVGCLAMHLPWERNDAIRWVNDNRATPQSIGDNLRSCLSAAVSLKRKADNMGMNVVEPFTGMRWEMTGGDVEVVGPREDFYNSLLPHFDGMPSYAGVSYPAVEFSPPLNFMPGQDSWDMEFISISDQSWTSAKNNSSVILQVTVDNRRLLFTGDAGIQALNEAASFLEASGSESIPLRMIQIPHHGSRNNVGPTPLNRIVGPITPLNTWGDMSAIVSCAPNGHPKHPNDRVLNAFRRRGARCFYTSGSGFRHSFKAPRRVGYIAGVPYNFQQVVADYD